MRFRPLWSARAALTVAFGVAMSMATPSLHGGAQIPPTEILTFASIADTYVDEALPTTNFNSNARLRIDAKSRKIVLLRFAVTGIGGRTVGQARVQLRVSSASRMFDENWAVWPLYWSSADRLASVVNA